MVNGKCVYYELFVWTDCDAQNTNVY